MDLEWSQVLALRQQWFDQCFGQLERTYPRRCAVGAPAAARDAIAARTEALMLAVHAKESVHVHLVEVQAALGRAEDVAEKKQVAVRAAREAADKALEHAASLRQRTTELTEGIHAGRTHGRRPVGLWRVARFLVGLAVGSAR